MMMRNSVFLAAGALAVSVGTVSAQWEPEQLPVYMPTTQHELEHYAPVADKASTVLSPMEEARFTVLTDRFIRMEYSLSGKFEDKPTLGFLNRKTAPVKFTQVAKGNGVTIKTSALTLSYTGGEFSSKSLHVSGNGGAFKNWSPSMSNDGNLLGTIKSLDQIGPTSLNCTENAHIKVHSETLHCTWGLVSRAGWSIYDDSDSPVLNEYGWWGEPSADKKGTTFVNNSDTQDWYGFFHGHDYKGALSDYVKVGGPIAMVPRQAMGIWWTRWFDFNNWDVKKIVDDYESRSLPLDVFVLDMDWHMKNGWTGWTFDKQLFPYPEDTLGYLKSRGLLLAANLHDALGVGNWDRQYEPLAKFIENPDVQDGQIQFSSCVNQKYAYGLEDIVLGALEKQGMDFWWIDWQQGGGGPPRVSKEELPLCEKGESCGGCAGGLVNPTIWTDKLRSTYHIRRGEEARGIVLARWGGLGNHRYQVGFSGDVNPLAWNSFAYQPYFSSTAANVGYGFWSHDIEGPGDDHELYTRWIQFAAFSAVFRSHDRGMSGGGCANGAQSAGQPHMNGCSTVKPWNVPTKFFEANRDAMQTRAKWLPLIYNATREAYETGVSILRPMYYEYPEENMAYASDMDGNFAQYFFATAEVFVAPVVENATVNTPSELYGGLASKTLWVPPGEWLELPTLQLHSGPAVVSKKYDITEIPVFVKAGSILPTVPLKYGGTIGMAIKPWEELEFTIYNPALHGSCSVYEDDGATTQYSTKQAYARTVAKYTTSGQDLSVTIAANSSGGYKLPTERLFTLKLTNSLPPTSVSAGGKPLAFSRWAPHPRGTWHFEGDEMTVVINLESSPADALSIDVKGSVPSASAATQLNGMKGKLLHSLIAKANLDETRNTPGAHTPYPGGSMISQSASTAEALSYLAGNDMKEFTAVIANFTKIYEAAIDEIELMSHSAGKDPVMKSRIDFSLAILKA